MPLEYEEEFYHELIDDDDTAEDVEVVEDYFYTEEGC